ncbi:MAG: roadblock/LC7 domain-containing protein [Rubrobacter sp.]|nr:roadblock/LC7 domain-containing protein [Rubrobacter sp.]
MAESSASGVGGVEQVLEDLRALSGEVATVAVFSGAGELRASTLPPGVDRDRYASMLMALIALAGRVARENGGSSFIRVRIKEEGGHVLLISLEGGGALAVTTGPNARIGLIFYDMRNAQRELERMLASDEGGPR